MYFVETKNILSEFPPEDLKQAFFSLESQNLRTLSQQVRANLEANMRSLQINLAIKFIVWFF